MPYRPSPRLKRLGFAGLLSCITILAAHGQTQFGFGGETCGAWIANDVPYGSKNFLSNPQHAWVMGAVSEAAIFFHEGRHIDILQNTDGDGLIAWIGDYCRKHPLDQLQIAVAALILNLAKRTSSHP